MTNTSAMQSRTNAPTVGGDGRWIRCFHPSSTSDVRLVCFPHAGGSAAYYFPLSRMLTPGIEVLAVQYPGRQDRRREECIDDIPDLADRIFDALSTWTDRPLAFFGHSMGAILAFEVARRQQLRTGTAPQWLFLSGRRAPSRHRDDKVHLRDDAGLLAEIRMMGGTDPRVFDDPEIVSAILPMTRADLKAVETHVYTPGPALDCPVTALVGDRDPKTTVDEAAAWAGQAAGEFELRVFPGGHFYLDEHRSDVATTISVALNGRPRHNTINGGTK
jgi:pyochelin biosynthetic protein PchC